MSNQTIPAPTDQQLQNSHKTREQYAQDQQDALHNLPGGSTKTGNDFWGWISGRDAAKQATDAAGAAAHPTVNGPNGSVSSTRNPDGSYTETTGFNGPLAGANSGLQTQLAANLSRPFDNGSAARDQAINAAYGQATSRLDPQWAQRGQLEASGLANQGLDPNSEAYKNSMSQFGRDRNDAYSSAMNSAIGQGTAAQQATFNENLQAYNLPLTTMLGLQGLLPNGQAAGQNGLNALQSAQNATAQSNANTADTVNGVASFGKTVFGGGSDERIKHNIKYLGYDHFPGVPAIQFEYDDAPGQQFQGVSAQDVEQVMPDAVTTGQDGVKRVIPEALKPKPVTAGGQPDPDPYANLTDQQIQNLVHLGVIPHKQQALEQQYAQAQALRGSHMAQGHSTGLGAAFAGIGDMVSAARGGIMEDDVRKQQNALYGEQEKGRTESLNMLRQQAIADALRKKSQANNTGNAWSGIPGEGE